MIEANAPKNETSEPSKPAPQAISVPIATPNNASTYQKFGNGVPEVINVLTKKQHGLIVTPKEIVDAAMAAFIRNPVSLVPLTPILRLNGKPYTLADHFFMEPLFKLRMPKVMVLKCGRQLAKSTSAAAEAVIRSVCQSDFRTMFVTPRFEQVRKLSQNYVKPFINSPLIRASSLNEECTQGVLQRSFTNRSIIFFAFAFLDADRIRGVSSDNNRVDETQDFNWEFIPIIQECMSASKFALSMYSGTPKTLDNTLEKLWSDSSKAEWVTKCDCCGYWNMATIHADLMKMIGKKTVVCAKCDKPINPRAGHWYHTDPKDPKGVTEFRKEIGLHVPQVIVPLHYEDEEKWAELIGKKDGYKGYTQQKFYNEVLGESADTSVRLITSADIRKASQPDWVNKLGAAMERIRKRCQFRVIGVDWGGGGIDQESFTAVALCGMNSARTQIECHFCDRFSYLHSHNDEVEALLQMFAGAKCHKIAHDFGGAGAVRTTLLRNFGIPEHALVNVRYQHHAERQIMYWVDPNEMNPVGYYQLDKPRSLVLQATCVKAQEPMIMFPEYESAKNVTSDLLNLIEIKKDNPFGSDNYLIHKKPGDSDDFAHALNVACFSLWKMTNCWPDLTKVQKIKMSRAELRIANPPTHSLANWKDEAE